MGWSCTTAAMHTMQSWEKKCRAATGSSNTWIEGGTEYFFETSHVEHRDGRITGTVYRTGERYSHRVGRFTINPDGTLKTAPAFLRFFWS